MDRLLFYLVFVLGQSQFRLFIIDAEPIVKVLYITPELQNLVEEKKVHEGTLVGI